MVALSTSARNAACNGIVDLIDVGSGTSAGVVELYTSSFGTLLVTLAMSNPAFGSASSGVATSNSITSATAVASGSAESYRIKDRDGNVILSSSAAGAVSETGGGGEMVLAQASTAIVSGQTVVCTGITVTVPAGS